MQITCPPVSPQSRSVLCVCRMEVSVVKWYEKPVVTKALQVFGMICAVVYLVLSILEETGTLAISRAALLPLYGIFWLCLGITNKNRGIKIMYYVLGTAHFLLALLYLLP